MLRGILCNIKKWNMLPRKVCTNAKKIISMADQILTVHNITKLCRLFPYLETSVVCNRQKQIREAEPFAPFKRNFMFGGHPCYWRQWFSHNVQFVCLEDHQYLFCGGGGGGHPPILCWMLLGESWNNDESTMLPLTPWAIQHQMYVA